MREFGVPVGIRTKLLSRLIQNACKEEGASEAQAKACGDQIEKIFIKDKEKGKKEKAETEEAEEKAKKSDTLLFLAPGEIKHIAGKFKEAGFKPEKLFKQTDSKKQAKEFADILGARKPKNAGVPDGLDIALFGRMVAQAAELDVEAAASFSHAISTHQADNELEFFTALDDYSGEREAAHMGSLEFNSATYYRYISLDLGQLYQTLGGDELIATAIEVFTKALYVAVPPARQTTQSAASPWGYAKVLVRTGQRLQVPFDKPVKARGEGYLAPSITELERMLTQQEHQAGSLYGKEMAFTLGEDEDSKKDKEKDSKEKRVSTIDDLIIGLQNTVRVP
jgi:CRISPR system Cascade subunit CasC